MLNLLYSHKNDQNVEYRRRILEKEMVQRPMNMYIFVRDFDMYDI